jgi:hypothetical protein
MGSRAGLDGKAKKVLCSCHGSKPGRSVCWQHFTDWATLAHCSVSPNKKNNFYIDVTKAYEHCCRYD